MLAEYLRPRYARGALVRIESDSGHTYLYTESQRTRQAITSGELKAIPGLTGHCYLPENRASGRLASFVVRLQSGGNVPQR